MADRFDLSGKVAVVTGGSRGLGKEMVLAETAYERFGKVDILVNNAGMSPLYDKVLGAALYYASDASSYCTGSVLALDGGAS